MKDYKETLLMPKTDFPMRASLATREPEMIKHWEESMLYERAIKKNANNAPFIIHDGPPYANGNIHIGHALNKVLKDFVFRYKTLKGFYSPFIWGWDTHGLPIESALIREKKINRKELKPSVFRKECEKYALNEVEKQKRQFIRLGVLGDNINPYVTLTKDFVANQLEIFAQMANKGLIYKGLKPILWSPSSESALAEAEIVYKEKEDESIYLILKTLNFDFDLLIWTTTPWTLPANLAVCINPEFTYVGVKCDDKNLIVAKELVTSISKKFGKTLKVIKEFGADELIKLMYVHPIFNEKKCPIICGQHVTIDTGTGLVHTAPGHGADDYIVGRKYNLPAFCPVDEHGMMTKDAGKYENLFYADANKVIISDLTAEEKILFSEKIIHSYPHDWRTEKPVIFRATPQWFCSIEKLKSAILKEIDNVCWNPKWGKERLANMIKDRDDWCISRQRLWGVPIPVFYCENNEPILDLEVINHLANLFRKEGESIWWEKDALTLLPKGYKNSNSPHNLFRKETDIMDVWFDSGSSFSYIKKKLNYFPFDLYLEGDDQFRGWFNSSLSIAVATENKSPYKTVLSHGFILDGNGNKMSKSKGNVIDPVKQADTIGADVLRLWVASVDYQQDCRISPELLKIEGENYRKIRNTIRFLLGNLADFTKENYLEVEKRFDSDKYVYLKLKKVLEKCDSLYESFLFNDAVREIKIFINAFLSNYYLDYIKDILYIEDKNSALRRSVQSSLYDVLFVLIKLLHPIIPFTTEEAYAFIKEKGDEEFLLLTRFPKLKAVKNMEALEKNYDAFMVIRDEILKALEEAREQGMLTKSITSEVFLSLNEDEVNILKSLNYDLNKLLIVSRVSFVNLNKRVVIKKREGVTCERCWQVCDDLKDGLCKHCIDVLGKGK